MSELLRQTSEPLFPKVLWERPINKRAAKKLLIIGGHANEFSKTQMAYQEAIAAGIGEAKVVLPDSVYKLTGTLPDCLFVPSSGSGSIGKAAAEEIFRYIEETDGVLLSGQLSHNAETITVVEQIVRDTTKPLAMTGEVIEMLLFEPSLIFQHPKRLLIASTQVYTKLAGKFDVPIKIKAGDNLMNKVELLAELMASQPANYVLSGHETIVQTAGQSSVTNTPKANYYGDGLFTTFWLQYPKAFEGLTTAAFILSQSKSVDNINKAISQIA